MAGESNIEWTDKTWNPVVGCAKVSSGCANCYAEGMSHRLAAMAAADDIADRNPGRKGHYLHVMNGKRFNGLARTVPEAIYDPIFWQKPQKIFVNSMSDLFHVEVPFEFIAAVFGVMDACECTWGKPGEEPYGHTFQILTKRPERAADFFKWLDRKANERGRTNGPRWTLQASFCNLMACQYQFYDKNFRASNRLSSASGKWPLPNVWLGTSVENQKCADERIPHLLKCPAAVRFLSCEPLLGAIDLKLEKADNGEPMGLHWVIAGGESGHRARPCNIEYIRGIVRQCRDANVACFVKQLGALPFADAGGRSFVEQIAITDRKGGDMSEWPEDLRVRQMPIPGNHLNKMFP